MKFYFVKILTVSSKREGVSRELTREMGNGKKGRKEGRTNRRPRPEPDASIQPSEVEERTSNSFPRRACIRSKEIRVSMRSPRREPSTLVVPSFPPDFGFSSTQRKKELTRI